MSVSILGRTLRILSCLLFLMLFLHTGCQEDNSDNGSTNDPVSYSYTDPVCIDPISEEGSGVVHLLEKAEVVGNHIYNTHYSCCSKNDPSNIYKAIAWTDPVKTDFIINPACYDLASGIDYSLFTVDKNEEYIYLFNTKDAYGTNEEYQVYKGNLSTGSSTVLITGDKSQLAELFDTNDLNSMRADDAGNVYIASPDNNGCIVKISASGSITLLASDLINPGFFDIYNGFLYVPLNLSTGKVVKIDPSNGNVTDVITNLTQPTNVVVDNYGNFVVRSLATIDGANYHRYDMYTADGEFINNVQDASGNSILSHRYQNMPLYIDSYNNLYFYHADGVENDDGITYNNPTGQSGIFKIGLVKN